MSIGVLNGWCRSFAAKMPAWSRVRRLPPRGHLMAFLTRWQDDQSRPSAREAARDLAVRALAPMAVWWLIVLAIGWAISTGP